MQKPFLCTPRKLSFYVFLNCEYQTGNDKAHVQVYNTSTGKNVKVQFKDREYL